MATQSLYRRYRPRTFAEVKGQDHVVRALRNAVVNHREGHAYLFSGPRGTGKTTSARILAKVLNCEHAVDGEPCCACESCIAVERGTSYDVHELDAASNSGIDAMRDLIEKTSLGTPGRYKVYILDEVHMLTKGAEAALLKTLEEPPPHVVFVLATTDPQKVSETIRSRTQHLAFHLLPMDVLERHIRWLAGDAGIALNDADLQAVLQRGGGSARDTVSALELVAAGGSESLDSVPLDEFIEALIEHDPGRALTVVAHAVGNGREPRTLSDDLLRLLRDCFLSLMAPELVQLPGNRQAEVADLAQRMGAAGLVRAMERLGEMLVEMRHAPDPRIMLEVALVQLTHRSVGVDVAALNERLERVESAIAHGQAAPAAAPVDPTTGRARVGGRAERAMAAARQATGGTPRPVSDRSEPAESPSRGEDRSRPSSQPVEPPATSAPAAVAPASSDDAASVGAADVGADARADARSGAGAGAGADARAGDSADSTASAASTAAGTATSAPPPAAAPAESVVAAPSSGAASAPQGDAATSAAELDTLWRDEVHPKLRGYVRVLFSAGHVVSVAERDGGTVVEITAPNEHHQARCSEFAGEVDAALSAKLGRRVRVIVVVESSPRESIASVTQLRPPPPPDDEVDTSELSDVPPSEVLSPEEMLRQTFPGLIEVDE